MQLKFIKNRGFVRLLIMAGAVSLMAQLQLMLAHGFMASNFSQHLKWTSLFNISLVALYTGGTILGAITTLIEPTAARLMSVISSQALAVLATVGLAGDNGQISPTMLLTLHLFGNTLFCYSILTVILSHLTIPARISIIARIGAAAAVIITAAIGLLGRSWLSIESVSHSLPVVRDFVLLLTPIVVLFGISNRKTLTRSPKLWWESIITHMPSSEEHSVARQSMVICYGGITANIFFRLFASLMFGDDIGKFVAAALEAIQLSWLGSVYLNLSNVNSLLIEQRQSKQIARLTTSSARQFLHRHGGGQNAWAAIVGIKTTNFTIDHDVDGQLQTALPVSLLQIRSEEIQRCVTDVLGPLNLHTQASSHRVLGAVNAENSLHPCIDTLKMFACMYLDAAPRVERRLKGLISLLPIIDPGLARILKPEQFAALINRNKWFFHFDFSWLDQQMSYSSSDLRYQVQLSTLSDQTRLAMTDYLEKTGGIGNLVWMGPEARARLLQEAPSMASVIETCPVPRLGPVGRGDEFLMFTIKFEQLIPRLQRYFNFDESRSSLLDFEPNAESLRLHRLLAVQLSQAKSLDGILSTLGQIKTVPWRGFREKDNALQLILAAHDRLVQILTPTESLAESKSKEIQLAHRELMEAVRIIGYPSQILHNAQMNKIALRDVDRLLSVAGNSNDPRFSEAWLVLATADFQRQPKDHRLQILNFINTALSGKTLTKDNLIRGKALDAIGSLARSADTDELPHIANVLEKGYTNFAKYDASIELCCHLLDTHLYIENMNIGRLSISELSKAAFVNHIADLTIRFGEQNHEIAALQSRWQELETATLHFLQTAS